MVMLNTTANAESSTNLLINPGFESFTAQEMLPGWSPFWSRETGAGKLEVAKQILHSGKAALHISHAGNGDWSVAQTRKIPVKEGDILTIDGWILQRTDGSIKLSVVTRDAADNTVDWEFGRVTSTKNDQWQNLKRKMVIPAGCTSVNFRVTGIGATDAYADDLSLNIIGSITELQKKISPAMLKLQNKILQLTFIPQNCTFSVKDLRNGRLWQQKQANANILLRGTLREGATLKLELWDVEEDRAVTCRVSLTSNKPEVKVTIESKGKMAQPLSYPQPFIGAPGSVLVVPMNEGILFPVDDATIPSMDLVAYGGHGICMPWYGLTETKSGAGVMTILNTPDDALISIKQMDKSGLCILPMWDAQRGEFGYSRSLSWVFMDRGGYVAQAKRYREEAIKTGLFKTLQEKGKQNPNVDRLIGAVNVWNWDIQPVELCTEMKKLGMDYVLWSRGGKPEELSEINRIGYLSSRYDIFQDVYPPDAPSWMLKEGWPEDLLWLPDGDWMRGWADYQKQPDGTVKVMQGGVICSVRGLARAKQQIPEDLKTHPYLCRFIDTTTASPWRECYNPAHPLTRSDDRKFKMDLLGFCSRDMKQVVGTETGIDPSVPYVHYYEGMMSLGPYRLPDAGRDLLQYKPPTPDFLKFQVGSFYRVPLWELVYHNCVVAQWYWGDSTNKAPEVWGKRDLLNILYGTPPMFLFDKDFWQNNKDRFVKSYRDVCPLARELGYKEMLSHSFLTDDHSVQRTTWSNGRVITVNFGDVIYTEPSGKTKQPRMFETHRK